MSKPDLRIVGSESPPRAKCDQLVFTRVEGKLVAFHNGCECTIAEAAVIVALIAREFYGEGFVPLGPRGVPVGDSEPERA